MAYIRAAASGNYSAPATWVGGVVPTTGDIACSGRFRIVLDVVDILATLSATNVDWVAAGGTALSASTHTGGFTTTQGMTHNIAAMRYSFFKSTATTVSTADLVLKGGSVTVGSMTQVADGSTNNTSIHVIRCDWGTYTPNSITLGDITPLSYASAWTNGSFVLANSLAVSNMGTCTLTTGRFLDTAGLGTQHGLISWGASSGMLNWTATSVIPRGASSLYYTAFVSTSCNFVYDLPANTDLEVQTISTALTGYAITLSTLLSFTVLRNVIATHRAGAWSLLYLYTNSASQGTVQFNGDVTINNSMFLSVGVGASLTVAGATSITCAETNRVLVQATDSTYSRAWTFNGLVTLNMTASGGYSVPVLTIPRDAPVRFNAGIKVLGYMVTWMALAYTVSANNNVPVTINGDLDASVATVSSTVATYSSIITTSDSSGYDAMRSLVITGSIRAPLSSSVSPSARTNGVVALMSTSSSSTTSLTVGGSLVAGVLPCITIARAFNPQITVNGDIIASTSGVPPIYADPSAAVTPIICNGMVKPASNGVLPVAAPWKLGASGQVYVLDQTGVDRYIESTTGVIPAAGDVRKGVSVGSSVGTLSVPSAGYVLKDIPVDAAVGTLDVFGAVSNLVKTIKGDTSNPYTLDSLWSSVTLNVAATTAGARVTNGTGNVVPFARRGVITVDNTVTLFDKPTFRINAGNYSYFQHAPSVDTECAVPAGGDFCVEGWVYPTAAPTSGGVRMLWLCYNTMNFEIRDDLSLGLWFSSSSNNSYDVSAANVIKLNQWQHIALCRSGLTFSAYVNGLRVLSKTVSVSSPIAAQGWFFFSDYSTSLRNFVGNVQDITVTYGASRYSGSTIQPPIMLYPYNSVGSSSADSLLTAMSAKINRLQFDNSNNVLASATVDMSGLTPRFNAIDTNLATANTGITAANNAVAGVKAKTDQLTFGAGGVIAQTSSVDYTARFDTLETQVANIPTLTYTTNFTNINTKLDTLQNTVTSGGVDLSPVTNALTALDSKVTGVKGKTDQLVFATGGVVADVTVSVQQAIDYTPQLTSIADTLDAVHVVTNTFQFNQDGVKASATVDLSHMSQRFDALDSAVAALPVKTHTDTQYNTLLNQLNAIGNATGAIDLTPVMTSLSQIYASVESVPRLTYSASFVGVNNKLDALASANAKVDLTPVLTAIAAIPAPNLTTITTKLDTMQTDVAAIKDTAMRVEVLSTAIRDKLSTATTVDLTGVEYQLTLLNSKFEGVNAPVQVVPTGDAGTTLLYAYCKHPDGTPVSGQVATLHIMQVVGEGTLLPDHTLTSTSDAEGLISFVLPRDAGISAMFEYRGRKERVVLVGDATQALPSIVAKL